MGNLLSSLYSKFFEPKFTILILGLDAAGKTSILNKFKSEEPNRLYFDNFHYIFERHYENNKFLEIDIGACDSINLENYSFNENGIIFVVDSHDKDRMEDALEEFNKILKIEKFKNHPILVLANKQDLDDAFGPGEIIEKFIIKEIQGRSLLVQGCSAKDGNGIKEGFYWMENILNKNN